MSESSNVQPSCDWWLLKNQVAQMNVILQQNESNRKLIDDLSSRKQELETRRQRLKAAIDRCTNIYKDVKENLVIKKENAIADYEAAIRETGAIVVDSNVENMRLKVGQDYVSIVNEHGHSLNDREGSADRAAMGLLMRYISIVKQPTEVVPVMIFDESFFTLSDNSADNLKDYIQAFSENVLILAIEQKDTLFNGIDKKTVYRFTKMEDGYTKITLEEEV